MENLRSRVHRSGRGACVLNTWFSQYVFSDGFELQFLLNGGRALKRHATVAERPWLSEDCASNILTRSFSVRCRMTLSSHYMKWRRHACYMTAVFFVLGGALLFFSCLEHVIVRFHLLWDYIMYKHSWVGIGGTCENTCFRTLTIYYESFEPTLSSLWLPVRRNVHATWKLSNHTKTSQLITYRSELTMTTFQGCVLSS